MGTDQSGRPFRPVGGGPKRRDRPGARRPAASCQYRRRIPSRPYLRAMGAAERSDCGAERPIGAEWVKATIYHNPRCSKSREALALLTAAGADVTIVEY